MVYMYNILLADSNIDTLEEMFKEMKYCFIGDYKLLQKKYREDSINYLGYKVGLQNVNAQEVPIRKDQL